MVAETKATQQQMVESNLLNKAIGALLKHHTNSNNDKNDLLGNESPIHVIFNLNRVPDQTLVSPRPIRVEIPHPLYKLHKTDDDDDNNDDDALEEVEVCLIVKDESKEWIKEFIEKFPKQMSYIKKVITLTSLRKKYAQYKDRRELCHSYDIFMADDRILPMVGKAIGKQFFKEKKQPIPIKLTRKEALPFVIEKCLRSTFMWISAGTCLSIKAGTTSMPSTNVQKNIQTILENAVKHIPRKWSNISAISIKTSDSVALPIYNKTPEELEEIAKLAKVERSNKGSKRSLEMEEDTSALDKSEEKKTKKQKKEEAMMKSPLLKALKKQKKEKTVESSDDTNNEKNKGENERTKKEKKVKKKRSTSDTDADVDVSANSKKESKNEPSLNTESPQKKSKKDSKDEKSDFIASKKFKGSKKGYVFKMGTKGLGYYVDIKPVPNQMAIDAFLRTSAGSSMKGKSRGSSVTRSNKKGRKGRRSSY